MSEERDNRLAVDQVRRHVYDMRPGDTYAAHPSGRGLIIANTEHPPLWVRVGLDGTVQRTVIVAQ